ncbi:MAG: hypothetical protein IKS67_08355, partial [Victivallales bacterium]|nr:hypothetical protein [Victivallales bacterium]
SRRSQQTMDFKLSHDVVSTFREADSDRRAAGSRWYSYATEFRNLQKSLWTITGSCGEAICVICVICGFEKSKIRVHLC